VPHAALLLDLRGAGEREVGEHRTAQQRAQVGLPHGAGLVVEQQEHEVLGEQQVHAPTLPDDHRLINRSWGSLGSGP
jgi:hypothetical protein